MRAEITPGIPEASELCEWLKNVRFRKTLIGGVDEADVWKKLTELEGLYETALKAERLRYDTLLRERGELADGGSAEAGVNKNAASQAARPPRRSDPDKVLPGEG